MHPMHHTIQRELMLAQVADWHRDAQRHRLAKAARRDRRPRHQRATHPVTGRPALLLMRRALAALAARSL